MKMWSLSNYAGPSGEFMKRCFRTLRPTIPGIPSSTCSSSLIPASPKIAPTMEVIGRDMSTVGRPSCCSIHCAMYTGVRNRTRAACCRWACWSFTTCRCPTCRSLTCWRSTFQRLSCWCSTTCWHSSCRRRRAGVCRARVGVLRRAGVCRAGVKGADCG